MLKRTFDLILTLAAAPLWVPLACIVAALVRLKLGSPVLFSQRRPGRDEEIFTLLKFRTMTDDRDENDNLRPDGERLTSFGKFLRRASLDELPGLVNVLKGELSLVGPRPLLVQYLDRYSVRQARRHEVRPGITGWAQVNGRNAVDWDDRLEMDVWYVENQSIWLDVKILFRTVSKVVSGDGVSAKGEATIKEFEGSKGKDGSPAAKPSASSTGDPV